MLRLVAGSEERVVVVHNFMSELRARRRSQPIRLARREVWAQHLDDNVALERRVAREEDATHPAAAQLPGERVGRTERGLQSVVKGGARHGRRMRKGDDGGSYRAEATRGKSPRDAVTMTLASFDA